MGYLEDALDYLRKGMKYIYTDELPMPIFAESNAIYIRRSGDGREHMYIALGKDTWYDAGEFDTPVTIPMPRDNYIVTDGHVNTEIKMHPPNCKNCGAPLHGWKCEYCGTEY